MSETRTAPFSTDDLEGVYRFLSDAAVVEGPPELRGIALPSVGLTCCTR